MESREKEVAAMAARGGAEEMLKAPVYHPLELSYACSAREREGVWM